MADLKVFNSWGREIDFGVAEVLMDEELREELHFKLAPCTAQEFFDTYADIHEQKFGEVWTLESLNPCY